ncbi:cell division protein ZapC [Psychrobium sp. 1_MG-2023]|uniref:cell division protein ZapC n=1 Tax=Psychrobium sp. 1_MG-2023 TaxID=3062624 RepID=UPI0026866423|nr:cell division protein ZapC [Psychrobium sp. 1_MG-2023]MDP2560366.1 cell division protein ZapC [Psychrobium sp. 1_MG-2023]
MLIKPSRDWQWNFCQDKNRLTLDMGSEMLFVSAFKKNELVNDAFMTQGFSIDHTEDFYLFVEKIEQQLEIPSDFIYQIALNALTAKAFYKPLMPKSWFFSIAAGVSSAQPGKVVHLQSAHETRHYVIVESNSSASTLLLIEREHQLDERKVLNQFDLIRVMNDRLMPIKIQQLAKESAA